MKSVMVRSVSDQILDRLAEGEVSVQGGASFTRNLQQTFRLQHVNRDELQRGIDQLITAGFVYRREDRFGKNGELITNVTARDRGVFSRVRVYKLTPEGVKEQTRRRAVPVS